MLFEFLQDRRSLRPRRNAIVLSAGDGLTGGEIFRFVRGFDIGGVGIADELPERDRFLEVAAFLELPRKRPVERGIFRKLLPRLIQTEDGEVGQAERVERIGHVHLATDIPGVAGQNLFAVFQHADEIAGRFRRHHAGFEPRRSQEREPTAAKVVAVLFFLGTA